MRLRNVDTAEIFGVSNDSEEYVTGQRHKAFVEEWVRGGGEGEWSFLVQTWKDDERGKYGRWLAVIERRRDGSILNEALIDEFGDPVRA